MSDTPAPSVRDVLLDFRETALAIIDGHRGSLLELRRKVEKAKIEAMIAEEIRP